MMVKGSVTTSKLFLNEQIIIFILRNTWYTGSGWYLQVKIRHIIIINGELFNAK